MLAEQQPVHHESESSAERTRQELEQIAAENKAERSAETGSVDSVEHQKEQIESARKTIDKQDQPEEPKSAAESKPQVSFVAKLTRAVSYNETMASLSRKLTPVQRNFSRVVHAPIVEKTSEVLETTVMRPSVATGAVSTTIIVGSVFYFFAHRYGYAMRGSELIVSLVVGGIIGLLVEAAARALRSPKH